MELKLYRYRDTGEETFGIIMVNGKFQCYTLEDTYRKQKIKGSTRIPDGNYRIAWHKSPKFGATASTLIGDDYIGMPMLKNVPGFSHILIHWGNNKTHTDGCILVGTSAKDKYISPSRIAWKDLYLKMKRAFIAGNKIVISIIDLEG